MAVAQLDKVIIYALFGHCIVAVAQFDKDII